MAHGRTRPVAHPRSRGALRIPGRLGEGWNVAVLCAGPAHGESAHQQLEETLAVLGLHVQCHVCQWRFAELGKPSVFEAAVDHALDADLVILAGQHDGPISEELQAVLAVWLVRCGAEASPLTLVLDGSAPNEETRGEFVAALRGVTDRAHLPLYVNLADALLVAWDLWEWKHFPWVAVAEAAFPTHIHALSLGQHTAVRHGRKKSPSHVRAGTGGTSRHALTALRQELLLRRCQP
jgi:hypothetical protein